jgi:hypothetical protein
MSCKSGEEGLTDPLEGMRVRPGFRPAEGPRCSWLIRPSLLGRMGKPLMGNRSKRTDFRPSPDEITPTMNPDSEEGAELANWLSTVDECHSMCADFCDTMSDSPIYSTPEIISQYSNDDDRVDQGRMDTAYRDCLSDCYSGCSPSNYEPSEKMEIPPENEWGDSGCATFTRDERISECGSPYLYAQTLNDFLAIDPYRDGANVDINNSSSEEEELIRTAWALLKANTDLIQWAGCFVRGSSDSDNIAGCVVEHLTRADHWYTPWVDISVHAFSDKCDNPHATDDKGFGGNIGLCRGVRWDDWMTVWSRGTDTDRLCAVINFAATLCHELTHVCHLSCETSDWSESEVKHDCCHSYLIGSVLEYCLYQRYSDALSSSCCSLPNFEPVFYKDSTEDVQYDDCVTKAHENTGRAGSYHEDEWMNDDTKEKGLQISEFRQGP